MAAPYTNADAVQLRFTGDALDSFDAVGTLPGVHILQVGGANGTGIGRLRQETVSGAVRLAWSPPGEATFGSLVDVTAGGDFLLEHSSAPENLCRVRVTPSYLASDGSANVYLRDQRNNDLAKDDVDEADAAAGLPLQSYIIVPRNEGANIAQDVRVWFDFDASTEIGPGSSGPWSKPLDEVSALQLGDLSAGGLALAYLRKNHGAAWASTPLQVVRINLAWTDSVSQIRYTQQFSGAFRVFNKALYRFYRALGAPPLETDVPFDTADALPWVSSVPFGDGVWYISMDYYNGILSSGFRPIGPNGERYRILEIASGLELPTRPQAPTDYDVFPTSAGGINLRATYSETGPNRATEYLIAYEKNQAPPKDGGLSANAFYMVEPIPRSGLSALAVNLTMPGIEDGALWYVRCQTRRDDGEGGYIYSAEDRVETVVTDNTGPQGPGGNVHWQGKTPINDR